MTLRFQPIERADWPAISAGFRDLGFEQSLAYSEAAAARIGAGARFFVLEDQGKHLAAGALRLKRVPGLGRGIAWLPGGPLICRKDAYAPDASTLAALLAGLRDQIVDREGHILRWRLSPTAFCAQETVSDAAVQVGFMPVPRPRPYRSIALDLLLDETQLMAALNGKWRTDLRFALKTGLTLERGQGPEIEARFMALFDRVQNAKGFNPDIPPGFHFPLSGPEYRVETLIAVKDGRDAAGIVIGTCAASSTYLFGATGEAGRPLKAGYLLQWEAIRLARAAGCLWYDLGGVDFDANPDVSRFKERMNGQPILSEVWQARPFGTMAGPLGALVLGLEALRARVKGR